MSSFWTFLPTSFLAYDISQNLQSENTAYFLLQISTYEPHLDVLKY